MDSSEQVARKRGVPGPAPLAAQREEYARLVARGGGSNAEACRGVGCLLYTSDAAGERSSVDLGGRRILKKNKKRERQNRATKENREEPAHKQR